MSLTPNPRFDPSELADSADPATVEADMAGLAAITRSLEAAASVAPDPSADFADAVMAAIAAEPAPAPASRFVAAVRRLSLAGAVAAVGDAWRTATSGPRPVAARAAAMALVLAVAVGITATGGVVVAGASWIIGQSSNQPGPTVPETSPEPSPSPEPSASVGPSPSPTVEPSPSSEPTESAEPSETAEPTETGEPSESDEPGGTDDPATPEPSDSDEPDGTPEASDDHGGSGPG